MSQWWNDDEVKGAEGAGPPAGDGGYTPPAPPPPPAPSYSRTPGVDAGTLGRPEPVAPRAPSRGVPVGLAVAAVVALIGGMLVYSSLAGEDSNEVVAEGEIFLERADEAGADPFFDEYETLVSFDPSDVTPPGAASNDTAAPAESAAPDPLTNAEILALSFKGNEPGLYGGTGNNATCNKAALIAFLETNPAKAQAWAGAQGIGVGEIRSFVEDLTTVVLLADTRVTNHGFRDGMAYPLQSVLQAGMAVMIDEVGTPRVKCGCGNPLKRPIAQSRTVVLKGEPWAGFDQGAIATVEPAATVVDTFVLRSTDTGDAIERPAGTSGEADVVTSLAAPRPTDELAASAAADTPSDAGESEGDPENATPESTVPSTSPPDTAPQSTLQGASYCEKYQSYIVEGLERFRDADGSEEFRRIEDEWYAFLLSAISDLSASAPAEIQDDWAVIGEVYGNAGAEGSLTLYSEVPRLATAEDRVVAHGEDVCGLTF